jgi:hypothetical protein
MRFFKTNTINPTQKVFLQYTNSKKDKIDFHQLYSYFFYQPHFFKVFKCKHMLTLKLLNELCTFSQIDETRYIRTFFRDHSDVYIQEHGIYTIHIQNVHLQKKTMNIIIDLNVDNDDNDDNHDGNEHHDILSLTKKYNYNVWRFFLITTSCLIVFG